MKSNHDAYQYASDIDQVINQALKTHSINENNYIEWTLFIRTVQTSLNLLSKEVEKAEIKAKNPQQLGPSQIGYVNCQGLPGGKPCIYQAQHVGPCHNENYASFKLMRRYD